MHASKLPSAMHRSKRRCIKPHRACEILPPGVPLGFLPAASAAAGVASGAGVGVTEDGDGVVEAIGAAAAVVVAAAAAVGEHMPSIQRKNSMIALKMSMLLSPCMSKR